MAFKLGSESRDIKTSKNVQINKKSFGDGTVAQANMDGSIDVDPSVDLNSPFGKRALKHEMKHMMDIEEGKAAYGDSWVMWDDKIYIRKNGNIDGPNGKWPEGDKNHPWEQEAIKAEKQ